MKQRLEQKKKAKVPQTEELRDRLSKLKEKTKTWGGARDGAGRPASQDLGGNRARVNIGFRLTEEYARLIESQREEGESISQAARRILISSLKTFPR